MQLTFITVSLRVLAVVFSASMLGGYVWFTQRKAQAKPVNVAHAEQGEEVRRNGEPVTVMLSSKNISQPIFSSPAAGVEGNTVELSQSPESAIPMLAPVTAAAPAVPLTWVLSGSKSYTGAVTVVSGQLRSLITAPEPGSDATGTVPSSDARPQIEMAGSKSWILTLIDPPPVPASAVASYSPVAHESISPKTPFHSKRLEFQGVLGDMSVYADGAGALAFPDVDEHYIRYASPEQSGDPYPPFITQKFTVLSSSKSGPVLSPVPPPRGAITLDDGSSMMSLRHYLPALRWDLGEAFHELQSQVESALTGGAAKEENDSAKRPLPHAASILPPTGSSVLSLPSPSAAAPPPTP